MAEAWVWIPRFIHILSGVIWIGGAALWTMLIAPRVLRDGPPPVRRPFLEAVLKPFTRLMIISGALTILSGLFVMGILTPDWDIVGQFQNGAYGAALGIGFVLSIAMYAEGWFVIKPTGEKLLATMQAMPPGPPSAETQAQLMALGKKVGIAGMISLLMGTIAIGAMVWAVNMVR